jgi:hypothetical protein
LLSSTDMLGRLAFVLVIAAAVPAAASQPLAINATCATALAGDASHVRTLRGAIARALAKQPQQFPAGYTLDVALVRLDVTRAAGNELHVRAEVRAALSDARGVVRKVSIASSLARGPQRDRALLQRDAIVESAWQLATRLAKRG